MNLAMKQDQENQNNQKIVPLSSDEIKSILKSQTESVFEDKNISNNSNFVKKSLIDIALDFQSTEKFEEEVSINTSEKTPKVVEKSNVTYEQKKIENSDTVGNTLENTESENKKNIQDEKEQSNNEERVNDTGDINLNKVDEDLQSEKSAQNEEDIKNKKLPQNEEDAQAEISVKDENVTNIENDNEKQQNEFVNETKSNEFVVADNETKQALDSVRDAVSQSLNKNGEGNNQSLERNSELTENVLETINKDYENFKNIFSSLSTLGEEAIYEVFQNKIFEISYELAGYQIDKMPDKYEKKIKSFLKNVNCYEDKITIELNDKDFEALSKLKDFNKNEDKKVFISNKELSRGDIILNCDGMRYSEKSNYGN